MHDAYFEKIYSEYWKKQSKIYGKQEDDGLAKIIDLLKGFHAKTAFEVGIGTGWPIASELYNDGTCVSGCDVSQSLIQLAQENYPQMKLQVGDIWQVSFDKEKYDLVYCIRSSWYMKDFLEVISKMLDITNEDGVVAFNVLNKQNSSNKKARVKGGFIRFAVRVYGALKVLFCNRDYIASCPEYHYGLEEISKILEKYNADYKVYSTNQLLGEKDYETNSQKLFFMVRKGAKGR